MHRGAVLAGLCVGILMAGCFSSAPPEGAQGSGMAVPEGAAYRSIDPARLSTPEFAVLPLVSDRVASSLDGLTLFVEIHRPNVEGPVPTILHSSPYNALGRIPGSYPTTSFPEQALVNYYVPRGYAVVVADVRGFGESEGCVEVWGPREQQDQFDLVEWIAAQDWSDGNVGMIGVSYPGTTPMEAAVMAPPHLKAIVAVAGLTDPYFDWHFGGVPNGESYGSPAAYQAIGALPPVGYSHGADWVKAAVNAGCGTAELMVEAYQPDGLYTEYYQVRNLSARVKDVTAAILYTQGFTDGNVKPSMLMHWFNEIDAPKKGIFGQWAHRTPVRDDWKVLEHAWFDHWLKGNDVGIMEGPVVEVSTNLDSWRADDAFPTARATARPFYLDAAGGQLKEAPPTETSTATYRGERLPLVLPGREGAARVVFESEPLTSDLYVSGEPRLRFHASLEGEAENTLFFAELFQVAPSGAQQRIVYGGLNAALRDGYTVYQPVPTGTVVEYELPFQPREWIVPSGFVLRLTLQPWSVGGSVTPEGVEPHDVILHAGPDVPSRLVLPVLEGRPDGPLPWSTP